MVTRRKSMGTPYLIEQYNDDLDLPSKMFQQVSNDHPEVDDFVVLKIEECDLKFLFDGKEGSNMADNLNPFLYCEVVYPKYDVPPHDHQLSKNDAIRFLIQKICFSQSSICVACNAIGIPMSYEGDGRFVIDPEYFS
jgi:hypothetical protein